MKKLLTTFLFVLALYYPTSVFAEERTDYLLHASKEDVSAMQKKFPHYTKSFEVLPMIEIGLTTSELVIIKRDYPNVDVFPIRKYETAATAEIIPHQFELIKTTPSYTSPYTGKGVKVAIIDSGIDVEHEDLIVKGGICTLLPSNCAIGTPYSDDLGHGTHVAGIIAAQQNGIGIVGVAPGVDLYSIKTISKDNEGTTTNIIAGVEWAIENKIDILNMSITTNRDDPALKLILEKAYQSGMILVASVGNEEYGDLIDSVQFPAKYSSVIAVSAITQNKQRIFESSMGYEVEIAAPGNEIFSTYPINLDTKDGNKDGYMKMSGTSMASPHVVGVIALLKERFPETSNSKLRLIVTDSAEDLGLPGRDKEYGYGLVQYPRTLDEIPAHSFYSDKGKINIELSNADKTTNRKLMVGDIEVKELSPGKWELYRLSGTYDFELSYYAGNEINETFAMNIDSATYKDLNPNKWYVGQIAYLINKERIFGYPDNTFRPDTRISRAEAVALLGRTLGLNGEQRKTDFFDVNPNSFASGYIQSALENGIIAGFVDKTFRPDETVTRAEMALLLQSAFQFPANTTKTAGFTDMTPKVTSYDAVLSLSQAGIIKGYLDGEFKPQEPMTRATFSVFLAGAEKPELFK